MNDRDSETTARRRPVDFMRSEDITNGANTAHWENDRHPGKRLTAPRRWGDASLAKGPLVAWWRGRLRVHRTWLLCSPAQRRVRKESMTAKTTARGQTQVTVYQPATYDERPEAPKLNDVRLTETFTGDIEGEGTARVLQAQWADGSLRYCTLERIVGAIAGRSGTFLLQVEGTVQGNRNNGAWSVVPRSATGDLRGLRGDGGFEAEHGKQGSWTLDYWFE